MIKRKLLKELNESLAQFPAVALLGPRQVGKTTLSKLLLKAHPDAIYIDLELPSDLQKMTDPEFFLKKHRNKLVIIDEVQRRAELFPILRALIDQDRRPGRFLLLGSASPDLLKQSSESLAGRIIYHELGSFSLQEVGGEKMETLWSRGGFPESFLANTDASSFKWRESFIQTYLERDLPQLGIRVPASMLRRFWTMLAHQHGQLWNASQLSKSLGVSAPTVSHYLDILEDTFVVRRLMPFHTNVKKRLVKSPKIYLRDSGLLHSLLLQRDLDQVQSHPILGASWEGFMIEQVLAILPEHWPHYFYRTQTGNELDLVFINDKNETIAVEIKYGLNFKLSRGFYEACKDLNCKKAFILHSGDESYELKEGVHVLSPLDLKKILD
jgi:predicted AAA+ superfamily ATPase